MDDLLRHLKHFGPHACRVGALKKSAKRGLIYCAVFDTIDGVVLLILTVVYCYTWLIVEPYSLINPNVQYPSHCSFYYSPLLLLTKCLHRDANMGFVWITNVIKTKLWINLALCIIWMIHLKENRILNDFRDNLLCIVSYSCYSHLLPTQHTYYYMLTPRIMCNTMYFFHSGIGLEWFNNST